MTLVFDINARYSQVVYITIWLSKELPGTKEQDKRHEKESTIINLNNLQNLIEPKFPLYLFLNFKNMVKTEGRCINFLCFIFCFVLSEYWFNKSIQ